MQKTARKQGLAVLLCAGSSTCCTSQLSATESVLGAFTTQNVLYSTLEEPAQGRTAKTYSHVAFCM